MNKKVIFSLFAMMLLWAGCDYNEDNFLDLMIMR